VEKDLKPTRRKVFKMIAGLAGKAGAVGLMLGAYLNAVKGLAATAIRPPGAIPEPDFQSACVRCGLCVRACPFDILKLATLDEPVATGTPFFVAREGACEMCEDIPCVPACPTGALDHALTDIKQADMGVAVFTGNDTCYAMQGTACRACYRACPIKDEAIVMKKYWNGRQHVFQPTVFTDACTGCGKCEEECITPEASIKVMPRAMMRQDTGLKTHG